MANGETALLKEGVEAVKLLHAYLECSEEVQSVVREMIQIVGTSKDEDERMMAFSTIMEALNPKRFNGEWGLDLEEAEKMGAQHSTEAKAALETLDREEQTFAERLSNIMEEKGVTQQELAGKIGVGQPAIAMMLARQCRPQKRTVARIAEALGVNVGAIWPID